MTETTLVSGVERTRRTEKPDENDVRAVCPCCGGQVVSGAYYVEGLGYIIRWTCWEAQGPAPTCQYSRVL